MVFEKGSRRITITDPTHIEAFVGSGWTEAAVKKNTPAETTVERESETMAPKSVKRGRPKKREE